MAISFDCQFNTTSVSSHIFFSLIARIAGKIFDTDENYRYFLWKMRAYLLPFGDIISYCLMPNHFHWQLYVHKVQLDRVQFYQNVDEVEKLRLEVECRKVDKIGYQRKINPLFPITLNEAIGSIQKGHTRAVNIQRGDTGSLFRSKCKAQDGWIDEVITVRKKNGYWNPKFMPGTNYTHHCFYYIHNNPVTANLVSRPEDWPYSSARDYAGLRNGTLCNLSLGRDLMMQI